MAELEIRATLSDPGGRVNEDVVGFAAGCAWVIDGATGFGSRRFTPGESDASWYARALDHALRSAALEAGAMPQAMLAEAIEAVAARFRELSDERPAPEDAPAAAVALVRATDGGLAYAILGDCALVVPCEGGVRVINDPVVGTFDGRFALEIRALHEAGVTDVPTVQQHLARTIGRLRQTMNRPEGYWIAAFEPEAARHAVSETLALAPGTDVLLASDGFLRLLDPFQVYDPPGLLAAAKAQGLEPQLRILRSIERADPGARRYPRLKVHDDASALWMTMTG